MSNAQRSFENPLTNNGGNFMKSGLTVILTIIGVLFVGGILLKSAGVTNIDGTERVVVKDWNAGILPEILTPGTHFYVPFTTDHYLYDVGSAKFIMGDAQFYSGEGEDTVDYPAFTVTTGGKNKEQPATFSVTLNYHLDPTKLVALHNTTAKSYEDLTIKPALTRIISDSVTTLEVLDFYSGTGRVALQKDIESAITNHPRLAEIGVVVDTFVIDAIILDPAYVGKIKARQLAVQETLKNIEETKAANQAALRVKAEAEAEKNRTIAIAEAQNEKRILEAQAEEESRKALARASRFEKEQNAKGLLAQGEAEAKVIELKKQSAYSGTSGRLKAQVEINQARVDLFKNMQIKGILDKNVALTIINDESTSGIQKTLPVAPARD